MDESTSVDAMLKGRGSITGGRDCGHVSNGGGIDGGSVTLGGGRLGGRLSGGGSDRGGSGSGDSSGSCSLPTSIPLLYGLSEQVIMRPGYWPSSVHCCGFWQQKHIGTVCNPESHITLTVSCSHTVH